MEQDKLPLDTETQGSIIWILVTLKAVLCFVVPNISGDTATFLNFVIPT